MGIVLLSKEAEPVARIIRLECDRPKTLPVAKEKTGTLRWDKTICPMGLHKKARRDAPASRADLPTGLTNDQITAFANWWDSQTDAKGACDAVWGGEA